MTLNMNAKMIGLRFIKTFEKLLGFRDDSLLILIYCRPGNVRRDQDGEWEVKGLWNSEI